MLDQQKFLNQKFVHRTNPNGSHDSICLRCYLTISTSSTEELLAAMEAIHSCHGMPLSVDSPPSTSFLAP